MADEAVLIGPAPARESYLDADTILKVAKEAGAEAIHPGYGFLSENADFAEAVPGAGIVFDRPAGFAIRAMGLKDAAKALVEKAGVPVVPGYHGARTRASDFLAEADRIGYPVLIKAVAGGGGKGMKKVDRPRIFATPGPAPSAKARTSFGDAARADREIHALATPCRNPGLRRQPRQRSSI
jgi:3-methylcrotonyl-CoA carboxylase alpha subunit